MILFVEKTWMDDFASWLDGLNFTREMSFKKKNVAYITKKKWGARKKMRCKKKKWTTVGLREKQIGARSKNLVTGV